MEHAITVALDYILEVGRAGELLRGIERLTHVLESFQPGSDSPSPVPTGVRDVIGHVGVLLAVATAKTELQSLAGQFKVDLRDLNETEVAYLERVSIKTVRDWRTNGTGPAYRNEAGIRYPILWLWEWRQKGRQTMTSQKATRGRRHP